MCRLLAWIGEPIFLEELVCKPQHSLVRQSMQAEEAKLSTNGDGFGLGWYTGLSERPEPGLYREVMPAWSDENLLSISAAVRSGLFFAHVRATTGTAVSRQNCHPFRYGSWLFMHNGQIGDYARLRRPLESLLPDPLYAARQGATDSELLFLLIQRQLQAGLEVKEAVARTLAQVCSIHRELACLAPLRFTAVLSEGLCLYAFRYASDLRPPSLYWQSTPRGHILASEPLQEQDSGEDSAWQPVPAQSMLLVEVSQARLEAFSPSPERA